MQEKESDPEKKEFYELPYQFCRPNQDEKELHIKIKRSSSKDTILVGILREQLAERHEIDAKLLNLKNIGGENPQQPLADEKKISPEDPKFLLRVEELDVSRAKPLSSFSVILSPP